MVLYLFKLAFGSEGFCPPPCSQHPRGIHRTGRPRLQHRCATLPLRAIGRFLIPVSRICDFVPNFPLTNVLVFGQDKNIHYLQMSVFCFLNEVEEITSQIKAAKLLWIWVPHQACSSPLPPFTLFLWFEKDMVFVLMVSHRTQYANPRHVSLSIIFPCRIACCFPPICFPFSVSNSTEDCNGHGTHTAAHAPTSCGLAIVKCQLSSCAGLYRKGSSL